MGRYHRASLVIIMTSSDGSCTMCRHLRFRGSSNEIAATSKFVISYESRYASDLVALGFFVIEAYQFSEGNTARFLGQP